MEDLRYNDPGLKKTNNPYYGQNLIRPVDLSVADSIRCWYMWPHYKVFVPDPTKTQDLQEVKHRGMSIVLPKSI